MASPSSLTATPCTIVRFPIYPVRSIEIARLSGDRWIATFCGDQWTEGFRTEPGPRYLVHFALKSMRNGLPIEDRGVRPFPYPAEHRPRHARDPFSPDPFERDPSPRPAA